MKQQPPLPDGYRYGEYAGMLTIECGHGAVSIDLKKRKFALGLTTYMPRTMQLYTLRAWKSRLILAALAKLQATAPPHKGFCFYS